MNLAFAVTASLLIGQSGTEPATSAPVDEVQDSVGLPFPLEAQGTGDANLDGIADRDQLDAGTASTTGQMPETDVVVGAPAPAGSGATDRAATDSAATDSTATDSTATDSTATDTAVADSVSADRAATDGVATDGGTVDTDALVEAPAMGGFGGTDPDAVVEAPASSPQGTEAPSSAAGTAAAGATALLRMSEQLQQLEARMAELETQATDAQAEVALLREQAATLEETAAEPGAAADQQRESQLQRVGSLEDALERVAEAYEIVETGESDVSAPLGAATAALEEGLALAEDTGSPGEAQRFEAALSAVARVPAALAERDYQYAKELLTIAATEGAQARLLAEASTTLPVTGQ